MNLSLDARSQRFLADFSRLSTREATLERQISSGYAVVNPSDGPDRVTDILQLKSQISRATGISSNLDRVKAEVDTAESALRVSVNLMEHARTVAAQGASTTAQNRPDLAAEIGQIQQQIVDITRTTSEGRYVFSGDADQTVLYSSDPLQAGGIVRNAQTANTREIEDVHGARFSVAKSASEIFDTRNPDDSFATNNTFNALHQLQTALQNDDEAGVAAASQLISSALDHLNRQLLFYGNVQDRLANASNVAKSEITTRTAQLSNAQDTDLPAAAIEISQLKVHMEAALGAQAQRPKSSLFDYLG